MGTQEGEAHGYPARALNAWARRARAWSQGEAPSGLSYVETATRSEPRDVFLYVISGHKAKNPAAAMALIEKTKLTPSREARAAPPPPARPGPRPNR